jgi:DNA adenine methylase
VKFEPIIKWSGSKRSQSEEIVKKFPKEINTYYEPFVGGASILFQLLHSNIKVKKIHMFRYK